MDNNLVNLNGLTDNTITAGGILQGQNCTTGVLGTLGTYGPCYSYPYYIYQTPIQYDITLRKVENGWILATKGQEFIISKPEEIVKYLKEEKKK